MEFRERGVQVHGWGLYTHGCENAVVSTVTRVLHREEMR